MRGQLHEGLTGSAPSSADGLLPALDAGGGAGEEKAPRREPATAGGDRLWTVGGLHAVMRCPFAEAVTRYATG
ncbi:hypothetical protein [Pyrobaculum neutrophilum]|uniref:hypothetical protein n=1 Tax=Pyrobaculum neutrophilum TaxID=70771 RepID=UPI0011E4E535|nr:hypothetical protein [Pyrobaculum neutrophilum]